MNTAPQTVPKLTAFTKEQALANWETFAKYLEPALDYGLVGTRTTIDDLRALIEEDEGMAFVVWDPGESVMLSVFIVRIREFPTGLKALDFPALGGQDLEVWLHHAWDGMKEFARSQGCQQIEFRGRPGWARVLQEAEPVSVNFVCELE